MFEVLGVLLVAAITVVVAPFICFWLSYFGGWICSLVIGVPLCTALNTLFQTQVFVPEMLPWIAGALGWIGGYFKSSNINTNKK